MTIGKLLIILGAAVAIIGLVLTWAPGLLGWFGHLPGDIRQSHGIGLAGAVDMAQFTQRLDPVEQLDLSIRAVFGSWNSERAEKYRQINKISGLLGTAVNVQVMVFGNMGETSGTGVCFSRDPSTGKIKNSDHILNHAYVDKKRAAPEGAASLTGRKSPRAKRT